MKRNNVYADVAKYATAGAIINGGIDAAHAYRKYKKAKADGKSEEEINAAKKNIYKKAAKGAAIGAIGHGALAYAMRNLS